VGVAAHITAASPGGPRYDASLSSADRQSAANGIWLCQKCAKLVDNDPERYTVSVLRLWKEQAEADALAVVEGKTVLDAAVPGHGRSLRVTASAGAVLTGSGRSGLQLFVQAANPGPRPVTVSALELHLDNGVRFGVPEPEANVRLPHRLEDGESCMLWISARDFATALNQRGYSGNLPFVAVVRDAVGDEFKSEPNSIDVEGMLRQ
jgi:hypothetical protein